MKEENASQKPQGDNTSYSQRGLQFECQIIASVDEEVEKMEPSHAIDGVVETVRLLWKIVWWFFKELNTALPRDPTILFLGICPREIETCICMKTCTGMCLEALFLLVHQLMNG